MTDLLVKGGKVVFPGKRVTESDIVIRDGKVSAIGKNLPEADFENIIDASGKHVFPGLVDSHFHIGIYRPLADDARSESASAAAGGVTTLLSYFRSGRNYLNSSEPYSTLFQKVLDYSRGNFHVDYGYNLAPVLKEHVNEIPKLVEEFGVSTYKFYMFYKGLNLKSEVKKGSVEKEYLLSDDPYDLGHLYNIMTQIASLKGKFSPVRLSIHAEDSEIIRINLEKTKAGSDQKKDNVLELYSNARPPSSERLAILEAVELATQTGCPINVLHVSSEQAIKTLEELQSIYPDTDFMVEVTASHLSISYENNIGVNGKVNPPIRSRKDVDALWDAVRKGVAKTVASDHAAIEKSKKGDELWTAENGYGATEVVLPAVLTEGYHKRKVPLETLAALVTLNPAKYHGLSGRKGDIAVGMDGDLAIVDLKEERVVDHRKMHSAQDFSPFDGLTLKGWPVATVLRGNVVFSDGKVEESYPGQYVKRPVQ